LAKTLIRRREVREAEVTIAARTARNAAFLHERRCGPIEEAGFIGSGSGRLGLGS
jgi:hypothetical protein